MLFSTYTDPIKHRKWETFFHPPEASFVPLVREFFSNSPNRINNKIYVRGNLVTFTKQAINNYFGLPTLGDNEDYVRLLSDVDMAMVYSFVCKPGIVWKMSGDVSKHFPRKCLLNKVRPWYAFICASLTPMTHLSDVSRERAILLYAIMVGASIDVGQVIFDSYMHCVRQKARGISFPYLITALCAFNE